MISITWPHGPWVQSIKKIIVLFVNLLVVSLLYIIINEYTKLLTCPSGNLVITYLRLKLLILEINM